MFFAPFDPMVMEVGRKAILFEGGHNIDEVEIVKILSKEAWMTPKVNVKSLSAYPDQIYTFGYISNGVSHGWRIFHEDMNDPPGVRTVFSIRSPIYELRHLPKLALTISPLKGACNCAHCRGL